MFQFPGLSVQVFSHCPGDCIRSWASDQIKGLERVYALAGQFDIAAVNLSVEGGPVYTSRAACDADNVARKAAMRRLMISFSRCPSSILSGGSSPRGGR